MPEGTSYGLNLIYMGAISRALKETILHLNDDIYKGLIVVFDSTSFISSPSFQQSSRKDGYRVPCRVLASAVSHANQFRCE